MKFFFAVFVFLFAPAALASTEKFEVLRAANVMVDNPEMVALLNAEGVNIADYSVIPTKDGFRYTFNVNRTCSCPERPGVLTVIQDLSDTFVDGPLKYTYTLKFKE